jgi:DNA repair protein RadC
MERQRVGLAGPEVLERGAGMNYPVVPERLYAGIDDEYEQRERALNPEVILPAKWQFLKVETVLERDPGWTREKAPVFDHPTKVRDFVVELLKDLERSDRERIYAIFLDQSHRALGVHEVHVGTLTESMAHPRELFKAAIVAGAAAIMFVHNHPSGQLKFSKPDLRLMARLADVSVLLGIRMLDFVAIGHQGEFVSAVVEGLLPQRDDDETIYKIGEAP